MKRYLGLTVAILFVIGLSGSEAQARGGGCGGRGAGGGVRSGGDRPSEGFGRGTSERGEFDRSERPAGEERAVTRDANAKTQSPIIQNRAAQGQSKAPQVQSHHAEQNKPFTPAWYANHPNAWNNAHLSNNAWGMAGLGLAAGWIGDTPIAGDDDESDDETDDNAPAQNQVTGQVIDDAPAANIGDWLPLGVFALAPEGQKDATALVQLALNKSGELRGSYYDVISENDQPIQGSVDKKTQLVTWTVGTSGQAKFQTQLADLTESSGLVSLEFKNGQIRDYTLARQEGKKPTP